MSAESKDEESFTLVFKGSLRDFASNPFLTDTPFGRAFAAGLGNAFEEIDQLSELLDEAGIERP